ncbi:MAG: PQQ-like beta-propeller repeat protein, partial [Methanomassiliicoccales archaeon]
MNRRRERSRTSKMRILAPIMIFFMLLTAVSILAEESGWSMYRYNDKRTGNSPLTSNIVEPKVKWAFLTGDIVKSPPSVGDINNDGEMEVVFGSNDHHLYALDRFGNELWNFPAIGGIINSPSIGDVDGDGLNEVIFGGNFHYGGDPNMYVVNGEDGSLVWQFETLYQTTPFAGFQASPLLLDINGDDINDVLIPSKDSYFYAFNGPDGSVIWQSEIFEHYIRASSPLGDIDHDGDLEVVVVDNHALIRIYEARTGSLELEVDVGHGVEATPVLADVDGDGYDEIILFTVGWPEDIGDVVVLNHDGSDLWRSSVHTFFYTSPTILDIDGDGLVDIIGGDSDDETIVAYKGTNGAILWETVLPDSSWSQAPLVTADIDGDGVIEVIAGANPNLYCLSTEDGAIEWVFETSGQIWGQPIVADLEQDGLAEVLLGCYDNYLYVLENALEPPVANAGDDQTIYEGETAYFNGTGSYDPNYDWHKLNVNFASDSALFLRTQDPNGPYMGAWEGGVMEWVTFSSNLPFWISKKAGHLGQGPAGKEYTYYWKMHESGNFTLSFRAANGYFTADVYDETAKTNFVSGLYVYQGTENVYRQLENHLYRVEIHSTGVLSGFPNDLDVLFELGETDILLSPDVNSLVYYASQNPLDLAIEGPGVTDITFYSRGIQEFYTYYAYQLDHSEDEVSGGELSLAQPPYDTGITPGEYMDTLLSLEDELTYTWDFDANVDSDNDGDFTNDVDATGPTSSHVYGD